jgi:hypothetical protein
MKEKEKERVCVRESRRVTGRVVGSSAEGAEEGGGGEGKEGGRGRREEEEGC